MLYTLYTIALYLSSIAIVFILYMLYAIFYLLSNCLICSQICTVHSVCTMKYVLCTKLQNYIIFTTYGYYILYKICTIQDNSYSILCNILSIHIYIYIYMLCAMCCMLLAVSCWYYLLSPLYSILYTLHSVFYTLHAILIYHNPSTLSDLEGYKASGFDSTKPGLDSDSWRSRANSSRHCSSSSLLS